MNNWCIIFTYLNDGHINSICQLWDDWPIRVKDDRDDIIRSTELNWTLWTVKSDGTFGDKVTILVK